MGRRKKPTRRDVDRLIVETLKEAPIIRGHTVTEIAEILRIPRPTAHLYLQLLEARGLLEHLTVGKTKVYGLKKKREDKQVK